MALTGRYRAKITIDNTKVSAVHTNYAVLITEANMSAGFWTHVDDSDGLDIQFSTDEVNALDREIVLFDSVNQKFEAYVRIASLSNVVDTVIYIYYGDATTYANDAATWNANFVTVHHNQEVAGNPVNSANPGVYDGVANNISYSQAGEVQKSFGYNGSNSNVNMGDVTELDAVANFTFSGWAWQQALDAYDVYWIKIQGGNWITLYTFTDGAMYLQHSGPKEVKINDYSLYMNAQQWTYIVFTYDGGQSLGSRGKIYIDGTDRADFDNADATTPNMGGGIHREGYTVNAWNGREDEVRFRSDTETAAEITTDYNNQDSPSTFYSVGIEEDLEFSDFVESSITVDNAIDYDEGGLWELGVGFPLPNPNMERFEYHLYLSNDALVGDSQVYIAGGDFTRILKNSFVIVGPSSDPTREDGTQLYYGKYEVFLIKDVNDPIIGLKEFDDGFLDNLQNRYLKGDPVTIRALAESWKFMQHLEFPNIFVGGGDFKYSREDSIDDLKGFSQAITVVKYGNVSTHRGIVQRVDDRLRSLINRLNNKNARMSAWVKAHLREGDVTLGNDIDENIAGGQSNDIDEGVGAIGDKSSWSPDIYESSKTDDSFHIKPAIRAKFYDDPSFANAITGYDFIGELTGVVDGTYNVFINQVITVPEKALSAKFAVYGSFPPNAGLEEARLFIDDAVIEHCVGTSKENNGFYKVDMNPEIDMNTTNRTSIKSAKDGVGIIQKQGSADPNVRLRIRATWQNRPGYFIDDLRIMEAWNKEGYPIILRTKMPLNIPPTFFCNMMVQSDFIKGRPGTEKADVDVIFEEIAV